MALVFFCILERLCEEPLYHSCWTHVVAVLSSSGLPPHQKGFSLPDFPLLSSPLPGYQSFPVALPHPLVPEQGLGSTRPLTASKRRIQLIGIKLWGTLIISQSWRQGCPRACYLVPHWCHQQPGFSYLFVLPSSVCFPLHFGPSHFLAARWW